MYACIYIYTYIHGMIWVWYEKKSSFFHFGRRFNPNFEDCFCWGNLKLLSSIQHTNTWKMQVNVTWRSGSVGYKPNYTPFVSRWNNPLILTSGPGHPNLGVILKLFLVTQNLEEHTLEIGKLEGTLHTKARPSQQLNIYIYVMGI